MSLPNPSGMVDDPADLAPPIPAELALDRPPIDEPSLVEFIDWATETADETSVDVTLVLLEPDDTDPPEQAARRAWQINDDDEAEWAMRKLAEAEATVAELKLRVSGWRTRIDRWFEQGARRPEATAVVMAHKLRDYQARRREAGGAATLELPSGKVPSQNRSAKLAVVDEAAFVAWARANLEAVTLETVVRSTHRSLFGGLSNVCEPTRSQTGWTLGLYCECRVETPMANEDGELVDGLTEWDCPDHGRARIVDREPVVVWVALDAEGNSIPGLSVTAPHLHVSDPKPVL